ncbi:MAG: hypothetical protein AMXMBFR36_00420 [Acidobacteriota bacterium]
MNRTSRTLSSLRSILRAPAVFLVSALLLASPAAAQQRPQIGLTARFAQLHEEAGTYPHSPGSGDHFGLAVAAADFNGDGYDDLASGIPGNDCDFVVWDCGAVQIRFGWEAGALGASLTLDPAAAGAPEPANAFDEYGRTLAAGDFDGDGFDDLAVGIPFNFGLRPDGQTQKVGGVQVHHGRHGSNGSIDFAARHYLQQDNAEIPSYPHDNERFGWALAVGDFDGDGRDDLAIGAPKNWFGVQGGNVTVAHGGAAGLRPFSGYEMRLGLEGLPDTVEAGEDFGWALAAGDFNGDGFDDLAIGVPSEDDVGAVLVVYGSQFSLLFSNHWYFSQIDLGDSPEPGDRFGEALTAGDFNGDGFDDLAVGAPREDGGPGSDDIGQVSVVYGGAGGLTATGVEHLWEELLFGGGTSEPFDNFGRSLVAGDFDADGIEDLAIGVSGENHDLSNHPNTGAVVVVKGYSAPGDLGNTVRRLHPRGGDPNLPYPSYDPAGMIPDHRGGEPFWGVALAAADFDGNGFADLAIGAANRDQLQPASLTDSGAVAVLYGQLFADGFETGDAGEWSSVTP